MPASEDFRRQMEGYGLTTVRVCYRFPDNPRIINPNWLLRQFYDVWPEFPELNRYLEWWQREVEGPIDSVIITHSRLIKPAEIRLIDGDFKLN